MKQISILSIIGLFLGCTIINPTIYVSLKAGNPKIKSTDLINGNHYKFNLITDSVLFVKLDSISSDQEIAFVTNELNISETIYLEEIESVKKIKKPVNYLIVTSLTILGLSVDLLTFYMLPWFFNKSMQTYSLIP